MKKLFDIATLKFIPQNTDFALLVLRLWLGISILILHGLPKLKKFSSMAGGFPDPFGIGSKASLVLAIFGEVACAALLALGLFTRVASMGLVITMAVAFFSVHKGALSGSNSGELAFIYLAGFVTLFLAGPGQFAVDSSSAGGKSRSK